MRAWLTIAGVLLCLLGCRPGLLLGGFSSDSGSALPDQDLNAPPTDGVPPPRDGQVPPPSDGAAGDKPPAPAGWSLGKVPFAPTSSWNTPIPASATYTKLAWPSSTGYNYYVNWDEYSPGVYISKPSDPLVQVSIPAGWGYPAGKIPVRLSAGITGAPGSDGEILIVDGTTVHNFWRLKRTSTNSATAESYGRADVVKDSGWGSKAPFLSAGITAAGSNMLAGLLVQAESDAGEILHALQIALDADLQKPGHTGEAIGDDGSNPDGISQEGERLAIPPTVAMPSALSPLGQKVFRAMQKYGVFNIDISGGSTILRAQANAFSAPIIQGLRKDVNVLIPLLQRVTF